MVMKMSTITWRLRAGRMARRSNRAPTQGHRDYGQGKGQGPWAVPPRQEGW